MRTVKLKKIKGRYYARFYDSERPRGKRQKRKSLKTNDRAAARRKLVRWETRFVREESWSPWERDAPRSLTLEEALGRFLDAKRGEVTGRTLDTYEQQLRAFTRACPAGLLLADVSSEHVRSYVFATKKKRTKAGTVDTGKPTSKATQSKRYRHVRAFVNWSMETGLISGASPLDGVRQPKGNGQLPAWLTPAELERLLEYIDWHAENVADCTGRKPDVQWLRDAIVITLCCGLRRGEIANLRWEDVDLERGTVHVRNREGFHTKNHSERTLPVRGDALGVLRRRALEAGETVGPIIVDRTGTPVKPDRYTKRFKRMVRQAKLRDRERLRFHSLRHSCGAWLASKGVSSRIIQEILGHESAATTEIYSHVAGRAVEDAMQRAFG